MKFNILKLQKYLFYLYTAFIFGVFIAAIVFSTSYYTTYLYGNPELVDFYTNELQSYNKMIFNFALVLVILFLISYLLNPKKYYPTIITFPVYLLLLITGIVLSVLIVVNLQDITGFYSSYDFSVVNKLSDYQANLFFPIFLIFCTIGLIVISCGLLVIYSMGFLTYFKKRGEANA